jgi:hypothetical protein
VCSKRVLSPEPCSQHAHDQAGLGVKSVQAKLLNLACRFGMAIPGRLA